MEQVLVITLILLCIGCVFSAKEKTSSWVDMVQGRGRGFSSLFGLKNRGLFTSNKVDAFLTLPQLLVKYGYPAESYKVQTEDGYILTMHRIPKPGATPVFLMHGILDSSSGWAVAGPQSGLAYYLSDLGYDVWMGNARGNRYSRKHKTLNTNRRQFWDFSFHEIGQIDVPAMIDFLLNETGYNQTHYIGHSQGTTALFVMCDQRPGYCDKIRSVNALAPIAYLQYARSPIFKAFAPFSKQLDRWGKLLGVHEFLPNNFLSKIVLQISCREKTITQALCTNLMFLITGFDSQELNKTTLPIVLGHLPAGASTKQIFHYAQLINKNYFRMFDYGSIKNRARYGSSVPPSYNLANTTAPVALHYSLNDWISHTKDVDRLSKELPNVIGKYLVPNPRFNHMDFLIAINSREVVYKKVAEVLKSFESD